MDQKLNDLLTILVLVDVGFDYAKEVPRAALQTVKHGSLVYPAQVLLATFVCIHTSRQASPIS